MQEDCKVGEGIEPRGRCHAQIFQAEQVCATAESRWLLGKGTRRCGPPQKAIRKKKHMVQLNLRVGQVQCASHNLDVGPRIIGVLYSPELVVWPLETDEQPTLQNRFPAGS